MPKVVSNFNEIEAGKHKKYYLNLLAFEWIKIEKIKIENLLHTFLI